MLHNKKLKSVEYDPNAASKTWCNFSHGFQRRLVSGDDESRRGRGEILTAKVTKIWGIQIYNGNITLALLTFMSHFMNGLHMWFLSGDPYLESKSKP